jgi:hypothetical protein
MAESRVSKNLAICQWGTNFYRIFQYFTFDVNWILLLLNEFGYS